MKLYFISNGTIAVPTGANNRLLQVSKRLKEKFDTILIISEDLACFFKNEGVGSIIYKETKRYMLNRKIGYFFSVLFTWFIRLIQTIFYIPKFQKDIIFYANNTLLVDVIPMVLGKIFNKNSYYIQVIYEVNPDNRIVRGIKAYDFLYRAINRFIFFLIKRFANIIFTANSQNRDELLRLGFSSPIKILPNSIDKERLEYLYKSTGQRVEFDGVFLGRLDWNKGAMDLIEIWKYLIKKKQDAKLAIIGNAHGNTINQMKDKIDEYNLGKNITIYGYSSKENIVQKFKNSKVFIFPSYGEGWGMAAAEAMFCRLPVVAYNLPVFLENFRKGMLICEKGDYNTFANNVLDLLNNSGKQIRLSKQAYELASHLKTWDEIAEEELKIINNI